jgi:hypothetical protein
MFLPDNNELTGFPFESEPQGYNSRQGKALLNLFPGYIAHCANPGPECSARLQASMCLSLMCPSAAADGRYKSV